MPTISDVARKAGVSAATVSRVIQGAKNVRPSTREKVEQAIEELGYVPSAVAQSLRSKRTRSLALVVSDITNTFWTTVARGVEDVAQRHDYSVLLCNTDENLAKQRQYLDVLVSQQVDGVIIAPFDSDAGHLERLRSREIPTVLVDRRIEGWDVDSVSTDSIAGARALVQHLISLGHERIAIVSGPPITSTAEDRVAGYCIALAEAGIPLEPQLIKRGEFRHTSGQELTDELLDTGLDPTAIFAGNNAIAVGVIDALAKRHLRIPQDIALVCFDDLPNASRIFPFLTVVAQPVYDLGVNAAQLLLSRLESEVPLRPRHVVLPSRLIVRHSCGSRLAENGQYHLSLPIPWSSPSGSSMVRPLSSEERRSFARFTAGIPTSLPSAPAWLSDYDQSDVTRLLRVLQHQEADRLPHLELSTMSQSVYEYVLEHELEYDGVGVQLGGLSITPEDHVDFALRLGMDAVPCQFAWQPSNHDLENLEPPPSLAAQLSYLERYLRAARGTSVGVIASFTSFFDCALLATRLLESSMQSLALQTHLNQLMDILLNHQEKVMRVVCDRFAADLALVVIHDRMAGAETIPTELFQQVFAHRMDRLVAPAREHDMLLMMYTKGKVGRLFPLLHDLGFNALRLSGASLSDLVAIKQQWAGKLAIVGGISTSLLARGPREEIEKVVRELCIKLAPGGGYVLGSSNGITSDIPPENLVAMTRAAHRYGRYGSLGEDS